MAIGIACLPSCLFVIIETELLKQKRHVDVHFTLIPQMAFVITFSKCMMLAQMSLKTNISCFLTTKTTKYFIQQNEYLCMKVWAIEPRGVKVKSFFKAVMCINQWSLYCIIFRPYHCQCGPCITLNLYQLSLDIDNYNLE